MPPKAVTMTPIPRDVPRRQRIVAALDPARGPATLTVDAKCHGNLAVHKGWAEHAGRYVVTSIPTGYLVTTLLREDDALRVALHLHTHHSTTFSQGSIAAVRRAAPRRLIRWLNTMRLSGFWTDPEPMEDS